MNKIACYLKQARQLKFRFKWEASGYSIKEGKWKRNGSDVISLEENTLKGHDPKAEIRYRAKKYISKKEDLYFLQIDIEIDKNDLKQVEGWWR